MRSAIVRLVGNLLLTNPNTRMRLACALKGHRVNRWWMTHTLAQDTVVFNGLPPAAKTMRFGSCARCGQPVAEFVETPAAE